MMLNKLRTFNIILYFLLSVFSIKILLLLHNIYTRAGVLINTNVNSELLGSAYAITNAASNNNTTISLAEIDKTGQSMQIDGKTFNENITPSEAEVLKRLNVRNKELHKQQESIALQKNILLSTEQKVQKDIEELKKVKADVAQYLKKYNQQEDIRIKSLIKIYENMKPKEAARIFNELDPVVLFEIISNMREVKVAPILANMDAAKARQISERFTKPDKHFNKSIN